MNIRKVRTKIKSIKNVRKITKAMQMVSAVKMRKAQQVALEGRPYREELETVIRRLVKNTQKSLSPLLVTRENGKHLVIVISSNKGLCGGFHVSLNRTLLKNVDIDACDFITVGRKAGQFVHAVGGNVIADFASAYPLNEVGAVFQLALEGYLKGTYNKVTIVYNRFVSAMVFTTEIDQMMPFSLESIAQTEHKAESIYTFEPSAEVLLDALLRNYLEEKIRSSILNSEAVEHSQRMIAMKNATDNAGEVITNLTLLANKLRQEKITYELLDMISATASVG